MTSQKMPKINRKRPRDESLNDMSGSDDDEGTSIDDVPKTAPSPKMFLTSDAVFFNDRRRRSSSSSSSSINHKIPSPFASNRNSIPPTTTTSTTTMPNNNNPNHPNSLVDLPTWAPTIASQKDALRRVLRQLQGESGGSQRTLQFRYDLVMKAKADLQVAFLPPWHEGMVPLVRANARDHLTFSLLVFDPTGARPPAAVNCDLPRQLRLPSSAAGTSSSRAPETPLTAAQLHLPDVDDELLQLSFLIYDNLQINYC